MGSLNIIDRFTAVFIAYIDSGFGLLRPDVAFLTTILVSIDIALAGLLWAMDERNDVIASLIKKVLYVGFFALVLNTWGLLADIIFNSFAGLGLKASASGLTPARLLQPGFVAGTGFTAAHPLLQQAGSLIGFTTFFNNVVTIVVLLFAWFVVVLAFFILSVQLFVTILEFKLSTLAGFVLVPFALWGKTTFLAERVLGNVIASGIKMMVLAVIIGIGTTFFGDFINALRGAPPDLEQAMSLVLASIALFGLGIYGPSIAAGLVAGAPQLGAGAVVTSVGAVAAGTMAVAGGTVGVAARGATALSAVRAGAALTATRVATLASGSGAVASSGGAASSSGAPSAAAAAVTPRGAEVTASLRASRAMEGSASGSRGMPDWARRMASRQRQHGRVQTMSQAIKDGDRPTSGPTPQLRED